MMSRMIPTAMSTMIKMWWARSNYTLALARCAVTKFVEIATTTLGINVLLPGNMKALDIVFVPDRIEENLLTAYIHEHPSCKFLNTTGKALTPGKRGVIRPREPCVQCADGRGSGCSAWPSNGPVGTVPAANMCPSRGQCCPQAAV